MTVVESSPEPNVSWLDEVKAVAAEVTNMTVNGVVPSPELAVLSPEPGS